MNTQLANLEKAWRSAGRNGAEAALRECEERFRIELKQLQDRLMQAEKLAGLGAMVPGMAHEINNPVQAIMGMAQLVLEEQDPANIREYTEDIIRLSMHIATIVRNVSCYARSSSQEDEVEVDLCERLVEAVKMVRLCPYFGQVEVVTRCEPMPRLRARLVEIDQVFVNLLSNAVQAMEGRGRLDLATEFQEGSLTVRISDSGCGIPKGLIHKVFDPFFTTKDAGKGTGLGLNIVGQIVNKYGGTIGIESEEGEGSTFTVQFPAERRHEEAHDGMAGPCCGKREDETCAGG